MSPRETDPAITALLCVGAALVLLAAYVLLTAPSVGPSPYADENECVVATSPDGTPQWGDCSLLKHGVSP